MTKPPRPDEFFLWCERCEDWIYTPSHETRCRRCSSKWAEMMDPASYRKEGKQND